MSVAPPRPMQVSPIHARLSFGTGRDGEAAEIFLKGQESLDTLSELERYRFDVAFTIWLQSVEQAYQDYREGSFSRDSLVAYDNAIPGSPSGTGKF